MIYKNYHFTNQGNEYFYKSIGEGKILILKFHVTFANTVYISIFIGKWTQIDKDFISKAKDINVREKIIKNRIDNESGLKYLYQDAKRFLKSIDNTYKIDICVKKLEENIEKVNKVNNECEDLRSYLNTLSKEEIIKFKRAKYRFCPHHETYHKDKDKLIKEIILVKKMFAMSFDE